MLHLLVLKIIKIEINVNLFALIACAYGLDGNITSSIVTFFGTICKITTFGTSISDITDGALLIEHHFHIFCLHFIDILFLSFNVWLILYLFLSL